MFCALIGCNCTTCAKLVDEKINRLFCCVSVFVISRQKYWSNVYILQIKNTTVRSKVEFFLIKNGMFIMNPQKKQINVHVTVILFILYSIWVHVESSKYQMICLKSPKSSEFVIVFYKQWSKKLNYVYFVMF